jgi:hypothetical protein
MTSGLPASQATAALDFMGLSVILILQEMVRVKYRGDQIIFSDQKLLQRSQVPAAGCQTSA